MNTFPKARTRPPVRAFPSTAAVIVTAAVLSLIQSCTTLAPGADPVAVRAEQAMKGGDALYKDGMEWWFTPGVAPSLSKPVSKVLEAIRTGFDPAYQDAQKALDGYKAVKAAVAAGKSGDVVAAQGALGNAIDKLAALVNQIVGQIPTASAPRSAGKPVPTGGIR